MKDHIDRDSKEKFMQGGFSEGVGYDEGRNFHSNTAVPDEELKASILQALEEDIHIETSNISVDVNYGEVTIAGNVPNRTMMRAVVDCIDGISGVKKIVNELEIRALAE